MPRLRVRLVDGSIIDGVEDRSDGEGKELTIEEGEQEDRR